MNFLAHAYLSFNQNEILVGNMISDFVKGKAKFNYPFGVQNGIQLHRCIDEFTDAHIATKQAKQIFKQACGRYAGAFTDVVYDYFLANDENRFSNEHELNSFAQNVYTILNEFRELVPANFEKVMPSMQQNNWLYNYRFDYGIQRSFEGLNRRAKFLEQSSEPYNSFLENKSTLKNCYLSFIDEVEVFAKNKLEEL